MIRLRRRQDNKGAPRSIAFVDPAIGEKSLLLLQDDLGFVRAIARLAAIDGLRAIGANGKLKAEDSFAGACSVENIPVILEKHLDCAAGGQVNSRTNFQVLAEFGRVTGTVPEMDVGAGGLKSGWDATDRFPILGENQKIVVDVIAIIERNITVGWFRTPNF